MHLAGGVKERGLISVSQRIQEVLNDGIRTGATAQYTTEVVEAEAHHFQVGKTLHLPGKTTQEFLGDQLQHHHVVALKGGEYVRVFFENGQQVFGHVASSTGGLTHLLDGVGGMRGVGHLQCGGMRLRFTQIASLLRG